MSVLKWHSFFCLMVPRLSSMTTRNLYRLQLGVMCWISWTFAACGGPVLEVVDGDGDGYGVCVANPDDPNAEAMEKACNDELEARGVRDCDDEDGKSFPGNLESCDGKDNDCNELTTAKGGEVDADDDGSLSCADCNDGDELVYPGHKELCDGKDNDCNGGTSANGDEADEDEDGYLSCADCDDGNEFVYPDHEELCDGLDNNCNGGIDEGLELGIYYDDSDGDGYGDAEKTEEACQAPPDYVENPDDCDIDATAIHPGADELCDDIDNDCDGQTDEDLETRVYYLDSDGDGYGDSNQSRDDCGPDEDEVFNGEDCDDTNAEVNPSAVEVCEPDGAPIDNDCDGDVDEGLNFVTYYADGDGDGYGGGEGESLCYNPGSGLVMKGGDCDDDNSAISPDASEDCAASDLAQCCDGADDDCSGIADDGLKVLVFLDADGDGYGDSTVMDDKADACNIPDGWVRTAGDCAPDDPSIHPGATEICDGISNDCDSEVDEGLKIPFYRDEDDDGFGNELYYLELCEGTDQYTTTVAGDCDDDPERCGADCSPDEDMVESCDGFDNDCDGSTDNDAYDAVELYVDNDEDSYGSSNTVTTCPDTEKTSATTGDCDDTRNSVYPGAEEVCDKLDNDCDGKIDENGVSTWYPDGDGDGYGENDSTGEKNCAAEIEGKAPRDGDCNDEDPAINPDADEVCDGVDNNCDASSQIDEGVTTTYYLDADGDGHGAKWASVPISMELCESEGKYTALESDDCDDDPANCGEACYPGAEEVCDDYDNNCNNYVNEDLNRLYYLDEDGDNFGTNDSLQNVCEDPYPGESTSEGGDCNDEDSAINPDAEEVCDGVDNNCNGHTDEGVQTTYYRDADNDGFGNPDVTIGACDTAPDGYVDDDGDCDDDPALCGASCAPNLTEICDGWDNDCDTLVDDEVLTTLYRDQDGDGYGITTESAELCLGTEGYSDSDGDCDDDPDVCGASCAPNLTEICDGWDNDCDGTRDDDDWPQRFETYLDYDEDGFGGDAVLTCAPIPESENMPRVFTRGDCDDNDPAQYPGASDSSDGEDMDCGGNPGPDAHVGLDGDSYGSIFAALNAASSNPGTVVWVGPGTYYENNLTFNSKPISLKSTHFSEATIINGGRGDSNPKTGDRIFSLTGGDGNGAILDGFTLTEGRAVDSSGGGAMYLEDSDLTVNKCVFDQNRAYKDTKDKGAYGGAVYIYGGSPTFSNVTFTENWTENRGGAVYAAGWVEATECTITIDRADFSANGSQGFGGGLYVAGTHLDLMLSNSSFRNNSAGVKNDDAVSSNGDGGGLGLEGSGGTIENVLFYSNSASRNGGGMRLQPNTKAITISNIWLEGNQAGKQTGDGQEEKGGGIFFYDSGADSPALLTISNMLVYGNLASYGGGLYFNANSNVTIDHSVIAGNSSTEAGDGGCEDSGGVMLTNDPSITFTHLIAAYNEGVNFAYDGTITSGNVSFSYSNLYENQVENGFLCDPGLERIATWDHVNEEAPVFLDGAAFSSTEGHYLIPDFHLSSDSPLVNYGSASHCTSGDTTACDPDDSLPDVGIYGGPNADDWDRDLDLFFDWFWPGDVTAAPTGYPPSEFDCDDEDSEIFEDCQ